MKIKNTSNALIILIIFLASAFTVYKGNVFAGSLETKSNFESSYWLEAEGEYFSDTLHGLYHHIVSDFSLVELLPREEGIVIIDGYENGRKYVSTEIKEDTLFINRLLNNDGASIVRVNGDYSALVQASAKNLKSLTLNREGRIDIPASPFGSNPDGEIFYKPLDWEKYALRGDDLNIYLNGIAQDIELFTEVDNLNIHLTNGSYKLTTSRRVVNGRIVEVSSGEQVGTSIILNGHSKLFSLLNPNGSANINAKSLKVDSVIVKSLLSESIEKGELSIQCEKYLEADLKGELDVIYVGSPKVKAKGRGYGRVVKKKDFSGDVI